MRSIASRKENRAEKKYRIVGPGDFDEVYAILEEAFPEDERMPYEGQRARLDREGYRLLAWDHKGRTAAFAGLWHLSGIRYIEQFAVDRHHRGGGLGAAILEELQAASPEPILLEVEEPRTNLARRRVAFYQRNGFILTPYRYTQPTLNGRTPGPALQVMVWPEVPDALTFSAIKERIFREVYGALLYRHHRKENQILIPIVDQIVAVPFRAVQAVPGLQGFCRLLVEQGFAAAA